MTALNLKVLISGAGIAGPCLVYWLTKTSHRMLITVIERSSCPRVTSQAIGIPCIVINIVRKMKLLDAIRSCSTTEEVSQFLNASGKAFAQFDAGDTLTAEYEILRADLSLLSLEATGGLEDIRYIYGDCFKSFIPTAKSSSPGDPQKRLICLLAQMDQHQRLVQ
jgi:2-polyprenyl-6-methoxyphenol hydroxylase-like FAD-dependent oxidoreductase